MMAAANRNGGPASALVTGGAGFIGSHLAEALHARGWRVHVLDDLSAGHAENVAPGIELHVADIRSAAQLGELFRSTPFDVVVHCAAQTSVERSMLEPELDYDVNVAGTRQLLVEAKRHHVGHFVFLSSGGAIYGETKEPATESALPAPRSFYGFHKYAAERLVRTGGVSHVILRASNVYGPRQRSDAEGGVVAIFMERLMRNQTIEIHGDGSQLRDFLHVSDIVSAVLAALGSSEDALWNVACGQSISILELAQAIAELTHQRLRLSHQPARPGDIVRSMMSSSALAATGNWGPLLPVSAGLRLTLAEAKRRIGSGTPPPSARI